MFNFLYHSDRGVIALRTSPYYPQSNGKTERFHKTIKFECVRQSVPLSLDEARRIIEDYIKHYNEVRLHSAIGYVAPLDKLNGRDGHILAERDRKLEEARESRRLKRESARLVNDSREPQPSSLINAA